ncbi:trypsin-like peptidase domain-containing protein [Streptomyces sp. NPDC049577]|uniref:S1C family serine protease n=1 Tax=Streptomyces sp. NPDC049577 TaxID=3155153 RepID=UPI003434E01E
MDAAETVPGGTEPGEPGHAPDQYGAAAEPHPRHRPDPYGTPPYGHPGPWAPAPPVQHPTPAAGTPAYGAGAPQPAPQPAAGRRPWWRAVRRGARVPGAPGQQPGVPLPHQPLPHQPLPAAPAVPAPPSPTADAPMMPVPGFPQPQAHHPQTAWRYDPWAAPAPASAPAPTARARSVTVTRRKLVAGAAAVALLAGGVGGGAGMWLERGGGLGRHVTLPQPSAGSGERDPGSVAGIAARTLPGVVTLHVRGGGEPGGAGTGTGFVLDRQGHILTNSHVVQPAAGGGSIAVTFNGGQSAKATLVGRDGGYDLAVIKVEGVEGLTPLSLGNSDSVRVGDSVVAIGAPFDLAGTVTTGIISAKDRPITAGGRKQDGSDVSYVDALQTDAPINPGNSGGPLMNAEGRVIGINSAIRSASRSDAAGEQGGSIGLGFAIPVNQARRVAEELINTGRATHPVIGVTLDMEYDGDGARVNSEGAGGPAVAPGGPADKAGIRPRDVITKVDGTAVHSSRELIVKVRSHRPGDRLRLSVERDGGQERTVELVLGSAG